MGDATLFVREQPPRDQRLGLRQQTWLLSYLGQGIWNSIPIVVEFHSELTPVFIISRNELDFSKEAGDAFHLYRVFQFRTAPRLYMLQGDVSTQLNLEPIDFRASFQKIAA